MPDVFGLNQGVFRVKVDPRTGQRMVVPPPDRWPPIRDPPSRSRSSAAPSTAARCRSTRSVPASAKRWRRPAKGRNDASVACHAADRHVLALVLAAPVGAYLKLGTRVGNRTESLRWRQFPIRYFVTNAGVAGVTAQQFQDRGDARLQHLARGREHAQTSSTFVGFVQARPFVEDGANVIGYLSQPGQDRTLAATTFTVDTTDGRILESDIYFNTIFPWSTADGGTADRYRRRVDRAARDRPSARAVALGARRNRAHRRRPPRHRRRGGDVPDRVHARQHRRPLAQGRRHRRHLRHLRHDDVLARVRQHQRARDQERPRRAGRARRGVQPEDGQARRRLHAERGRETSSSPGSSPGRTSCAPSRSTMATSTASSTTTSTSTSTFA